MLKFSNFLVLEWGNIKSLDVSKLEIEKLEIVSKFEIRN